MNNISNILTTIPASSREFVDRAVKLQTTLRKMEQVKFVTEHLLMRDIGLYTRTVKMPHDTTIVGAHTLIPMQVSVVGDVAIFIGDDVYRFHGYGVVHASAGRKQIFKTFSTVFLSITFPTKVRTIREAEMEFTDEYELLPSLDDADSHRIVITGD